MYSLIAARSLSRSQPECLLEYHFECKMELVSDQAFFLGSPIIFKVAYSTLNGFSSSDLETLPSLILGEVRWCRKLSPAESSSMFGVGVKYYPQVY
jgi:hypothetical protein